MVSLFTYGSLMCNDIMFAVTNCRFENCKATLNDFYRSEMRDEEYPGVTPHFEAQVDGVLYFDLPEWAIERLDVFEGEYYARQDVQVCSEKFGKTDAVTYVVKPQYYHLLTGTEWSYAHFLAIGKKKFENAYFGFRDLQGFFRK